jgi:hypothetical protein
MTWVEEYVRFCKADGEGALAGHLVHYATCRIVVFRI